jgi:hypothetical protein
VDEGGPERALPHPGLRDHQLPAREIARGHAVHHGGKAPSVWHTCDVCCWCWWKTFGTSVWALTCNVDPALTFSFVRMCYLRQLALKLPWLPCPCCVCGCVISFPLTDVTVSSPLSPAAQLPHLLPTDRRGRQRHEETAAPEAPRRVQLPQPVRCAPSLSCCLAGSYTVLWVVRSRSFLKGYKLKRFCAEVAVEGAVVFSD